MTRLQPNQDSLRPANNPRGSNDGAAARAEILRARKAQVIEKIRMHIDGSVGTVSTGTTSRSSQDSPQLFR